jgi:hypothetical protein
VSTQPAPKQNDEINLWERYEQRKAELPKDLSDREYQEACKRIADELGI